MQCNIVIEMQGVLSKPLYTTFTRKVKGCNGIIRVFNQETNEFLIILNHDLKHKLCDEVKWLVSVTSYCLSTFKVNIIAKEDEQKYVIGKLRRLGQVLKEGINLKLIIEKGDYLGIGFYRLGKNVVTIYLIKRSSVGVSLHTLTLTEVSSR